ncbi:winged helix-turn-helix transcriptional regulator [Candidatus Woesearchaeota archaeon]|nr:winged helix-turn-helix transcriptional regulator [Candidatus Woesearchaeota archaeon]
MDKELINDYSWILRGKQRRTILKFLNAPKTPTLIMEETKIKVSNVSDVLRAMENYGLAKCLNPKEKQGRLYQLTKKGKKVREMLYPE